MGYRRKIHSDRASLAPTEGNGRASGLLGWLRGRTASTHHSEQLSLQISEPLSMRLRRASQARDLSVEALALRLLRCGLDQEALRARAEASLALLTPREREVAWLAARGHTNQEIAENLIISPETVKTHVRNVLGKYGLRSKVELQLLFLDLGLRWWQEG